MILLGILEVNDTTTHIPERIFPQELKTVEMFEFSSSKDKIVITGASPSCPFCGRLGVVEFEGYNVCTNCIADLKKLKRKTRRKRNG